MTTESLPTAGGTVATVSVSGLAAGQYHWQARMVSGSAPVGEWTPFGGNANGAADFEIVDSPVAYSAAASPAVVQDGDLVSVTIVADAAGYSVTADFLGLDSAYTPGDETVTPGPPGTYVVTYTISAGNTRADGPYLIPITVTRAPGIDVAATASFQLDNTPPAAPAITAPTAGATVTGQTLTISGTAPAGTSVAVTSDVDGVVGIATASPAGDWSMASTLSVGSHSLTATATEDSGLVSATSTAVGVTIQSVRPLTVVKKSEKCGATGLEALLIVMLLRLARGKGHRRHRSGKMPGPCILKEVDL
jgi:hypothetical protein